ncbi:unnamed protein product, partial [Porites lobata]
NSELVDDVVSLFKGYLETKLEAQGKLFEGQSKIQRSASEFKFSNRKQFEVINAKLECLFSARIKASADNPTQQIIHKRQKLINIADCSKDGWLGVQEY